MSTTSTLQHSSGVLPATSAPTDLPRHALVRRLPATVVGLAGAGVMAYGVSQPWLSTYAGLISQTGWGTTNGNRLLAGALVSAVLALAALVWNASVLRWLLALAGFASTAFAGYLLIQLYTVTQQLDSMALVAKGPGLYVVTGGAALVFATIMLPMPVSAPTATRERGPELADSWLLRPLRSVLRYPVAVLVLVAGLAHIPVTPEHLNEARYLGILFMVLTVACILLTAALLIGDSRLVWAGVAVTCLLAVAGYVLSRTVGLPLVSDDIGQWFEPLGVLSIVTESAAAGLAVLALVHGRRPAQR